MSTVDLNRLIIRKKYFVPIRPSELERAILKELEFEEPSLFEHKGWLSEKRKNYWQFLLNFQRSYILGHSHRPRSRQQVNALAKEYDEGSPKTYFEELKKMTGGDPYAFSVYIAKIEPNGCIVDVELKPMLYQQVVQLNKIPKEYEMQHSYLTSERFLKTIFESGLSATTVSEEKLVIPKPVVEFLINDPYVRQITEKIEKMFEEATNEILIMGWIGTFFISKFKELKQKGINIFVITGNTKEIRQDIMRNEKERAFKELVAIIGKSYICCKPEFHGRMVVVDNKAIIGSVDLDSYSLTGTRIELAAYTEDPTLVLNLRNYFKKVFSPWKETPQ